MVAKKSLLKRLEEDQANQSNVRNGLVAVMSHKNEIAEALERGFTVKKIYQIMLRDGEVSIGYQSFARLVSIYVKGDKKYDKKNQAEPASKKEKRSEPKGMQQLKTNRGPRPDHVYDPDRYDPDELI